MGLSSFRIFNWPLHQVWKLRLAWRGALCDARRAVNEGAVSFETVKILAAAAAQSLIAVPHIPTGRLWVKLDLFWRTRPLLPPLQHAPDADEHKH